MSTQPRYTRLDAAQFEALVRAYEASLSGRRAGVGVSTRFLLARGMVCEGRSLPDANFTGSDLSGSSFANSDLRRASFYCCNLAKCDFRGSRMDRADLRGCKFSGADLSGAVLDEADLRAAVLCASDEVHGLRLMASGPGGGGRLDRSAMDNPQAFAVDFSNCSLRGVRMQNANLKNANFADADLEGADFAGARLGGANFNGANLAGVNIERLGLPRSVLANAITDPTAEAVARVPQIREAIERGHAWVTTNGKAGQPGRLDGLDLRPAAGLFRNRLMIGLSAKGVLAIGIDFSDSELAGANFDGADLRSCNFQGADLRGASFKNAKLTHAELARAKIGPLPLRDGSSRPTNFDGAMLDGTGIKLPEPPADLDQLLA